MSETYISKVIVNLWKQEITLEWTGPDASDQDIGPFHCSPGAGKDNVDCDDVSISTKSATNCTPKGGDFNITGHQENFPSFPDATDITLFQRQDIALHYYPNVPIYPASRGCVRIASKRIAELIRYNTNTDGTSKVSVQEELRPEWGILLEEGSSGQNVKKMQRQLQAKGYRLKIDGDFGTKTKDKLKNFQKDNNIDVDGKFGPQTYEALFG